MPPLYRAATASDDGGDERAQGHLAARVHAAPRPAAIVRSEAGAERDCSALVDVRVGEDHDRAVPTPPPVPDYHDTVELTARVGYDRYSRLGFYTSGAEAAVRLAGPVSVALGAEAWAVRRVLPPSLALETGRYNVWDVLVPVHAGLRFSWGEGRVRPQLGVDAIAVDYTHDADRHYFAVGGRARGGAKIVLAHHLAAVADLSVGGWGGSRWSTVADGVPNGGVIAQIAAGVVVGL